MSNTNEVPHVESNALMPSISIDALLAARDEAHRIYFETAELLRAASKNLDRFGVSLPTVRVQFPGDEYLDLASTENDEAINREIDRFVWVQLFQLTNIDTIMDHKTRRDLFEQLGKSQRYRRRTGWAQQPEKDPDELPELTKENIEAVFQGIHDNQLEYFERCVESVYKALSWEHKTNEPGRIGTKIITTNAFYQWQRSMQGDSTTLGHHEHIHDLERVLCILNGDAPPTHESPGLRTIGSLTYGKWYDVPNPNGGDPLMSMICYRKGTAHIKILNKAHRDDMNRIMANRYPGAISEPQGARRSQWGDAQAKKPKTSTALAKTDKQARQAFYTPETLADEVAGTAFPERDYYGRPRGHGHTVLEPSAGEGALARAALRADCGHVTAIENDPKAVRLLSLLADRVNVRDEHNMSVDGRDFFDVTPASYPDGFDVVMMNPPFSNEQEVEHVLHAWEFVKPGGRLVAIMSNAVQSRTTGRYKIFADFLQRNDATIRQNPASSFKESGTNVNTVTVVIDKPENTNAD
jgi:16S rRNA G966 N2-methylase RsmD